MIVLSGRVGSISYIDARHIKCNLQLYNLKGPMNLETAQWHCNSFCQSEIFYPLCLCALSPYPSISKDQHLLQSGSVTVYPVLQNTWIEYVPANENAQVILNAVSNTSERMGLLAVARDFPIFFKVIYVLERAN